MYVRLAAIFALAAVMAIAQPSRSVKGEKKNIAADRVPLNADEKK